MEEEESRYQSDVRLSEDLCRQDSGPETCACVPEGEWILYSTSARIRGRKIIGEEKMQADLTWIGRSLGYPGEQGARYFPVSMKGTQRHNGDTGVPTVLDDMYPAIQILTASDKDKARGTLLSVSGRLATRLGVESRGPGLGWNEECCWVSRFQSQEVKSSFLRNGTTWDHPPARYLLTPTILS